MYQIYINIYQIYYKPIYISVRVCVCVLIPKEQIYLYIYQIYYIPIYKCVCILIPKEIESMSPLSLHTRL